MVMAIMIVKVIVKVIESDDHNDSYNDTYKYNDSHHAKTGVAPSSRYQEGQRNCQGQGKLSELMITVWAICTDNGPDPTGCRHMLHNQTGRDPTSWVFDTNCFLHQYQLIIKAELFTLDFLMKNLFGLDFGFFAMLSKTMHLWRDKSHDIYLCIAWQFGAQARKVASTVPPSVHLRVGGAYPGTSTSLEKQVLHFFT